ncbi:hypothetical protein ACQP2X_39795 [Actinoplanes sp. CA-131856]
MCRKKNQQVLAVTQTPGDEGAREAAVSAVSIRCGAKAANASRHVTI